MVKIEKNIRHLSDEDIEILALRWAKDKHFLNNRNVSCFIAGLEMARDWLVEHFSEFIMEEGLFLQNEYVRSRVDALSSTGTPLHPDHSVEFEAAKDAGELLIEASRIMQEKKVLT